MIPSQLLVLANHLWQSTLLAAVACLLTVVLQKNRAQIRYCLWLAASVKFLIPFSLLVMLGSQFAGSPATVPSRLPFVIDEISQPFAVPASAATVRVATAPSANLPPAILCAVCAIGFVVLISSWWKRWGQIHAALRTAALLPLPIGVEVRSSPSFPEPGVFGVRRPVLLLPHGIMSQLTAQQTQAILTA